MNFKTCIAAAKKTMNWRFLAGLAGFVLLLIIIIKSEPAKILQELKDASPAFLFLAVLSANMVIVVQAARGYGLLPSSARRLSFMKYLKFYYLTISAASVMPGRIGLAAQVPLLYKAGVSAGDGIINTIMDKIYDLIGFCLLALLCTILLADLVQINMTFIVIVLLVAMAVVWYLDYLFNIILKCISKLHNKIGGKLSFLHVSRIAVKAKLYAIFFTLIRIGLTVLMHFLAAYALNLHFSWLLLAAGAAYGALVSLLPFTIMGAGARDIVFLALYGGHDVSAQQVIAYSSLILLVYLTIPALGALVLLAQSFIKSK